MAQSRSVDSVGRSQALTHHRRSTKRDQQIRELLKQLEALGADSQRPGFLRDIRVRRTVDGVSLGLLDDLAAILAGLLPSPKGGRRAFTGRLAQRIVDAAPAIGRPVGEVVTEVVQHFRLDAKAAQLLRKTVDRLLDERDSERPRPRGSTRRSR